MAGVHGLQHVQGLATAALAHHDAVGAHAQAVDEEVPDADLALAFQVGRARFQGDHVRLLQLQLGAVLDGDDALAGGDVGREGVEQGGLARTGAAGDQDVLAGLDGSG